MKGQARKNDLWGKRSCTIRTIWYKIKTTDKSTKERGFIMNNRRLISIALALILSCTLLLNSNYALPAQAAGSENGSVLDTPFRTITDGSAKVTVSGTRFMVGDKELWFNGVNTPWNRWNDFGATDGAGNSTFDAMFWEQHFAKLHENGINASRVWISCNGDVGMNISSGGSFLGATELHWKDLDTLVAAAEKYQIYLMATVQSFDHYKTSAKNYKAWRAMMQDSDKIDTYVDNYIIPLVKRYDSSDYFWSIDLCNEPDWVVENAECGNLSWKDLSVYYAKAAAAIHKNSDVQVTVGLGMIKYNSDQYQGNIISDKNLQAVTQDMSSYVDFYSTHWYSWEKQWFGYPFDKSPKSFKLDGTKPSVVGECAAKTDSKDSVTLKEKYQTAYQNGWNGVFAWKSSGTDDGCGLLDSITPATNAMLELAGGSIFPLSAEVNKPADTTELTIPEVKVTTGESKVILTWSQIPGATGCEIYMASSKNGKYTLIKRLDSGNGTYVRKNMKVGKTYYFKVRAVINEGGTKVVSGYSKVKAVKVK